MNVCQPVVDGITQFKIIIGKLLHTPSPLPVRIDELLCVRLPYSIHRAWRQCTDKHYSLQSRCSKQPTERHQI